MNKFKFYFLLTFAALALFSCNKDDDKTTPPRDYAVQYATDIDLIEGYLKTHYAEQVNVDGLPDIKITEIPANGTQTSIWDSGDLKYKMIKNDNRKTNFTDGRVDDPVNYKLYYLLLNQGGGQKPTEIDSTFISYRGWTLSNSEFDKNSNPLWFTFEGTAVSGFRQFWPLLNGAESSTVNPDGTVTYTNIGAGVAFIPSGLAYFNSAQSGFPAYSPLVFTIRLHGVRYRDHDRDGILSKNENLDALSGDEDNFNDDTDGDKIPNFLDVDDDGDTYRTKDETPGNSINGIPNYLDPAHH